MCSWPTRVFRKWLALKYSEFDTFYNYVRILICIRFRFSGNLTMTYYSIFAQNRYKHIVFYILELDFTTNDYNEVKHKRKK